MENINLIRKIVWSFHHSTKVEWDDLFQEAVYSYYKNLASYNPDKGKISTYIWSCISSDLIDYIRKTENKNAVTDSIDEIPEDFLPLSGESFFDILSEDAKEIASLVSLSEREFSSLAPSQAQRSIQNALKNIGWDLGRIQKGINELRLACLF